MPTLAPKLPYTHPFAGGYPGRGSQRLPSDPDALAYLAAVAAADGAAVEVGVAMAVDDFIRGCKADGIWGAIKASCILCGARTLAGALVPLVGAAPTNNNFVSGDYNRETGLVGNGSTKYLGGTFSPVRDDIHLAFYSTSNTGLSPSAFATPLCCEEDTPPDPLGGRSQISHITTAHFVRGQAATGTTFTEAVAIGFHGVSRASSANYVFRRNNTQTTTTRASDGVGNGVFTVFAAPGPIQHSPQRLAFFSLGESLSLALLDTRVSALITAIGAAI